MLETRNVRPSQAARYYSTDNYTEEQDIINNSLWHGLLSKKLSYSGTIEKNDLANVLKGYSKNNHPLRHHWAITTGDEIGALDCVFMAPKTVSLQGLIGGDPQIFDAHRDAVIEALRVIESRFAYSRVSNQGQRNLIHTGKMLIAMFQHDTSRDLDPHLHTHCLIINTSYIEDRGFYALDNRVLHQNKKWLGRLYQHELSVNLAKYGYDLEFYVDHCEIKGFSRQQIIYFSKRSQQIQPLLSNDSWIERQRAASKTRARKGELEKGLLRALWIKDAEKQGINFPLPGKPKAQNTAGTLDFYSLNPDSPIEAQEDALLLQSQMPFARIEEAITLNTPMIPIAEPPLKKLRKSPLESLRNFQIEEAIETLIAQGKVIIGETHQAQLIRDWMELSTRSKKNAVLITQDKLLEAQLRDELIKNEWGNVIQVETLRPLQKSKLRVGDYLQPLRIYRSRGLSPDRFYKLLACRGNRYLLSDHGREIDTQNNFQFHAFRVTSKQIHLNEPLQWTNTKKGNEKFSITKIKGNIAKIQFQDASVHSFDLSEPIPIKQARNTLETHPNPNAILFHCTDNSELDLPKLLQITDSLRVYGNDVKTIVGQTKTSLANHSAVFSKRLAIEQELSHERVIGTQTIPSKIYSRDGGQNQQTVRTTPVKNRDEFANLPSRIGSATQWRWLQRDSRVAGAARLIHAGIQSTFSRLKRNRQAIAAIYSIIANKIAKAIGKHLKRRLLKKSIEQNQLPLREFGNQLTQFQSSRKAKNKLLMELAKTINNAEKALDQKEFVELGLKLHPLILNSNTSVKQGTTQFIETQSLQISANQKHLWVAEKGKGKLAILDISDGQLSYFSLSPRQLEICRRATEILRNEKKEQKVKGINA